MTIGRLLYYEAKPGVADLTEVKPVQCKVLFPLEFFYLLSINNNNLLCFVIVTIHFNVLIHTSSGCV